MTTKSPTTNVRSREIIGVDQFSQRREVFDKYDTVFLPLSSPANATAYNEVQPIITSNHGKTTTNFKRNAPTYSSMRESRTEDRVEFRARKYSDNFTADPNRSDDIDYRFSMTDRTLRVAKLRREFLKSNLHDPNHGSPLARTGTRTSMPVNSASVTKYKIESPDLYKFPFAEPYATPPPVRKVVVDLGPAKVNGEKENRDPAVKPTHLSVPSNEISPKIAHQKLFAELVKRYSPERKPVDWKLPPTRPRVIGSVPKSTSSAADSLDSTSKKHLDDTLNKTGDDDVFVKVLTISRETAKTEIINDEKDEENPNENATKQSVGKQNGPEKIVCGNTENYHTDSKTFSAELEENNDKVPELTNTAKQSTEKPTRSSNDKYTDITIPALIEKMTVEGEDLESHKNDKKKVKRKRSFLDKLFGRKKDK